MSFFMPYHNFFPQKKTWCNSCPCYSGHKVWFNLATHGLKCLVFYWTYIYIFSFINYGTTQSPIPRKQSAPFANRMSLSTCWRLIALFHEPQIFTRFFEMEIFVLLFIRTSKVGKWQSHFMRCTKSKAMRIDIVVWIDLPIIKKIYW